MPPITFYIIFYSRFWRRDKKIGEVTLPLKNFDFTFETSLWCKILNEKTKNETSEDALFEIISDNSSVIAHANPFIW